MRVWWCYLSVACSLLGGQVAGQLECSAGETKASSRYFYDESGRSCEELIGSALDYSDADIVSVCERWMGSSHPDRVNGAYVTYCKQMEDGSLQYRVDACCEGDEMRCFRCTNFTSGEECREEGIVETCGADQVCQTTTLYPYTDSSNDVLRQAYRDTQCADVTSCSDMEAENGERCKDWLLDTRCVTCCNTTNCNHDLPDQMDLYVGDDACLSNPCHNGATCESADPPSDGFTCLCTDEWTGSNCTLYAECYPSPCQNGGYCHGPIDDVILYECRCTLGYTGDLCQTAYPECSGDATFCKNGGTCIDHGAYGLRCKCPPEYVGSQCETPQLSCIDASAYQLRIPHFASFVSTDCTSRIKSIQDDSTYDWLLNYLCPARKAPPGRAMFVNNRDGYVEKLGGRSYQTCEKGEQFAYYREVLCCPTCHSLPCQNGGWCVQNEEGEYICKCRPGWYGQNCELKNNLCMISGDPHYKTFDDNLVHFQGFSSYELASSRPELGHDFKIVGTNKLEKAGDKVSYLKSFTIDACGHQIILGRNHLVKVDGYVTGTDVDFECFKILMNGMFVRLETEYNLVVEYDGIWTGFIIIPSDFSGQVQGLCGNFDGDVTDDYITRDGSDVRSETRKDFLLGAGWATTSVVDRDPGQFATCDDIEDTINSNQYCGLLLDTTGPFQACLSDTEVLSAHDLTNCQYDVCANRDSEEDMKTAACSALKAFAVKCKAAGHVSSWRDEAQCSLNCPSGMTYMESTSACPATCREPDAPELCHLPNTESCVCPEGTLLHNGACHDPKQCGCVDQYGNQFQIGDYWWTADCSAQRRCNKCDKCSYPIGIIFGRKNKCKGREVCRSIGLGVADCVSDIPATTASTTRQTRPVYTGTFPTRPQPAAPSTTAAPREPTSITTINDELISGTYGNMSVKSGTGYIIRTEVTGENTPDTIQLYKLIYGKTDTYICYLERECQTPFSFSANDIDSPEAVLGSTVSYGTTTETASVQCYYDENDSGVGRVTALYTLWLTLLLVIVM